MAAHPQLGRLTKLTDMGAEQPDGSAPRDHATLTGAVRLLGGNVPLVTLLLYVHAALLRMSSMSATAGPPAGSGGGCGGGTNRDAFRIALMGTKGLHALLAFVCNTVG